MIKNIILAFTVLLGIFMLGIVSVDERQSAIVTNLVNQKKDVLSTGVHFVWPLLEKVNYVFINERDAILTTNLVFSDNTSVIASSIICWKVTDPLVYFNNGGRANDDGFNRDVANKIMQIVASRANSTNLSTFNQLNNLLLEPLKLDDIGVVINTIAPNELKLIESSPKSTLLLVKQTPMGNNANNLAIESAYYQAQSIKTEAQIEQSKMLQHLATKDPKFYAYFRQLQMYKNSATSKQDLPPLQKLYR